MKLSKLKVGDYVVFSDKLSGPVRIYEITLRKVPNKDGTVETKARWHVVEYMSTDYRGPCNYEELRGILFIVTAINPTHAHTVQLKVHPMYEEVAKTRNNYLLEDYFEKLKSSVIPEDREIIEAHHNELVLANG